MLKGAFTNLVSFAAVSWGGALRDDPNNGCEGALPQSVCLYVLSSGELLWEILNSPNIVSIHRELTMIKLNRTSVVVYCISAAENPEFERCWWAFCMTHYYTALEGDQGGKLIFDRSSVKPIFTQKLDIARSLIFGTPDLIL